MDNRRSTGEFKLGLGVTLALAVVVAILGCTGGDGDRVKQLEAELATITAPTPTPSATEVPTATLTPTASPTPSQPTPTRTPAPPTATPSPVPPDLVLEKGWTCNQTSTSYATTKGLVTNNSAVPLRNVEAVVTWKTKDGTFITSDDSLIDYNPILPGQSSPFDILTRYNPAMATCNLAFKFLGGGSIRAELR